MAFRTIKNPVMLWLFIIFAVLNIADLVMSYPFQAGETNPIYLLTGSKILGVVLKVVFIIMAYVLASSPTYPGKMAHFSLILGVMLSFVILGIGIYSGSVYRANPMMEEYAKQISSDVKVKEYFRFISIFYVAPFLMSLLAFWAYDRSERHIKYGDPGNDWWKIWKSSGRK